MKHYQLSKSAVLKVLADAGVKMRQYPGLDAAQIIEAAQLYKDGWSLKRLAERFGVATSTVQLRLVEVGVQMRSPGRPAIRSSLPNK